VAQWSEEIGVVSLLSVRAHMHAKQNVSTVRCIQQQAQELLPTVGGDGAC